jgi:hypothetical protein
VLARVSDHISPIYVHSIQWDSHFWLSANNRAVSAWRPPSACPSFEMEAGSSLPKRGFTLSQSVRAGVQ